MRNASEEEISVGWDLLSSFSVRKLLNLLDELMLQGSEFTGSQVLTTIHG